MKNKELVKLICSGYCSFYKPGKDEELACRGFTIFERRLEERREVPARPGKMVLSTQSEDDLFQELCRRCPFFEADCDFASWKRGEGRDSAREDVNPCGGFLCLGHCIDHGAVDIQDINRVS